MTHCDTFLTLNLSQKLLISGIYIIYCLTICRKYIIISYIKFRNALRICV